MCNPFWVGSFLTLQPRVRRQVARPAAVPWALERNPFGVDSPVPSPIAVGRTVWAARCVETIGYGMRFSTSGRHCYTMGRTRRRACRGMPSRPKARTRTNAALQLAPLPVLAPLALLAPFGMGQPERYMVDIPICRMDEEMYSRRN
jgi:hypothetical protein